MSLKPVIGRVSLSVADLTRSIHFYQMVVGLQLLENHGNPALFGTNSNVLLELHDQPGAIPARGMTGLYHFALLLPGRNDLARCLEHLAQVRAPITGTADHAVSEAIYLTDPDGHGIEIYRDRPRDEWIYEGDQLRMTVDPLDVEGLLGQLSTETPVWSGIPDKTIMGHIHLHVATIAETERFYHDLLGFDIIARYGPAATFLATNGYHHHIGANTWAGVNAPRPGNDIARLLKYEIIAKNVEQLTSIALNLDTIHYPYTMEEDILRVKDPSGNQIEILAG